METVNHTNQASGFREAWDLRTVIGEAASLRIEVLGGLAFYKGLDRLEVATDELALSLVYLAFETLAVPLSKLADIVGCDMASLRQQLRDFKEQCGALDYVHEDSFRLHAEVDMLNFSYAVSDGYFQHALKLYQARPEQALLAHVQTQSPVFQAWQADLAACLHLLFLDALRGRYETLALADDIEAAIAVAKEVLSYDPLDEYTHQRVMQLELFRGNFKGALEQFASCKTVLETFLGLKPMQETSELADIIEALAQDNDYFFFEDPLS